jgi:sporulation protein YlmC with PRC-barrel domain
MSGEAGTLINLAARVVNRAGEAVGQLNEVVIEIESRRVAGFLVVTDEAAPREVFVMVGQVAEVAPDRLVLDLTDREFVALPDAREHLFVAPDQDVEAEVAGAESGAASPASPDPDERPAPSAIPGIALTPNLLIPLEVERGIIGEDQITLRDGMRVRAHTGDEIGQLRGVIVDGEARLSALSLTGNGVRTIDYSRIDTIDDDASELTLRPDEPATAAHAEGDVDTTSDQEAT